MRTDALDKFMFFLLHVSILITLFGVFLSSFLIGAGLNDYPALIVNLIFIVFELKIRRRAIATM